VLMSRSGVVDIISGRNWKVAVWVYLNFQGKLNGNQRNQAILVNIVG
jgi:hypothetical protein